jgi:hypothetical protein
MYSMGDNEKDIFLITYYSRPPNGAITGKCHHPPVDEASLE